jgi:hypothetical protein
VKLEEVAASAQEVKETRRVVEGGHAALEAVDEALREAEEVCCALEAAGLVKEAEIVIEVEQMLASLDASPEVRDKVVQQAGDLVHDLQEKGEHGELAAKVAKLHQKLKTAANAEKEAEIDQKDKEVKDTTRGLVREIETIAVALKKGGDEELGAEVEVMIERFSNDLSPEAIESGAADSKKVAAKLRATGRDDEAAARRIL